VAALCPDVQLIILLLSIRFRDPFCGGAINLWRDGATGWASDLRSRGRGFDGRVRARPRDNSGQVVHTIVPLSSSGIGPNSVPVSGR